MLPILELIRLQESEAGTFGVLKLNKHVFCVTLEPPDIENAMNISSIPAQQYKCVRKVSGNYGETFLVTKVPFRDNILFHPGNIVENTEGCILLGEHFGKLSGDRAVLNSGKTFKSFMFLMKSFNEVHLTITEKF